MKSLESKGVGSTLNLVTQLIFLTPYIPLHTNCCPSLRLGLDLAAPKLLSRAEKARGSTLNLMTQGDSPLLFYIFSLSVNHFIPAYF